MRMMIIRVLVGILPCFPVLSACNPAQETNPLQERLETTLKERKQRFGSEDSFYSELYHLDPERLRKEAVLGVASIVKHPEFGNYTFAVIWAQYKPVGNEVEILAEGDERIVVLEIPWYYQTIALENSQAVVDYTARYSVEAYKELRKVLGLLNSGKTLRARIRVDGEPVSNKLSIRLLYDNAAEKSFKKRMAISKKAKKVFVEEQINFVSIPECNYSRGDNMLKNIWWMKRSFPAHEIETSGFLIAETPVTYSQWAEVYDWALKHGYSFDNPGQRGAKGGQRIGFTETEENNRHPVVGINWYDAVKWCNAKSEKEGLKPVYYHDKEHLEVVRTGNPRLSGEKVDWNAGGYRLPTEVEWEKAARGGLDGKLWPWGDEERTPERANFGSNEMQTTVVKSYRANSYGLYDMIGNVWEWCWDWYAVDWYDTEEAQERDNRGPALGDFRVLRGDSWFGFGISAERTIGMRIRHAPGFGDNERVIGFRPVRSILGDL